MSWRINIEKRHGPNHQGYSMIELLLCLTLTLIVLGAAVSAFSTALAGRSYQAARTDAIVSAEAAINIMSREIGNSGYGLLTNGIVLADSTSSRLHIRSNVSNNDYTTDDQNEDVTFFCNSCTANGGSIVRFDAYNGGSTSGIINSVSNVQFQYWDYNELTHAVTGPFNVPTLNTGRITITLTVVLTNVQGAPPGASSNVTVTSDVTLRNSPYMLNRY